MGPGHTWFPGGIQDLPWRRWACHPWAWRLAHEPAREALGNLGVATRSLEGSSRSWSQRGQTHPTAAQDRRGCSGTHKSNGARTLSNFATTPSRDKWAQSFCRLRASRRSTPRSQICPTPWRTARGEETNFFPNHVPGAKFVFRADGRAGKVGATWGNKFVSAPIGGGRGGDKIVFNGRGLKHICLNSSERATRSATDLRRQNVGSIIFFVIELHVAFWSKLVP